MARPETGGSAFPTRETLTTGEKVEIAGLTLRDWFAGQALTGLIEARARAGGVMPPQPDNIPRLAYEYADDMLAEREKG